MTDTSTQMNLHKRYNPNTGCTRLLERGEMGLARLDFGILSLSTGEDFFEDTVDNEVVLIVLGGRCELLVGHNGNKAYGIIGERPDVFRGEAYRAYIPYRTTYEIRAYEQPVEVAICKVPSYLDAAAAILEPGEEIGGNVLGSEVIVGETETPIQSISGEAICFYRFQPAEGWADGRIYNDGRSFDQSTRICHNDVIALPKGYHAELVESSDLLYCLWIVSHENH